MRDFIYEILLTMRTNKLRTALTGFAIAWGILMTILLLAVSNGLNNGASRMFNYMKTNTISIYPGRVSQPYKGMPSDRNIRFTPTDVEKIRRGLNSLAQVEAFSPIYNKWDGTVSYKTAYVSANITGVSPDFFRLRDMKIVAGRTINGADMRKRDKVIMLHENTANLFFGEDNPLGKLVTASGLLFKVVGVYSEQGSNQNPPAYIPFETAQTVFNSTKKISDISFMVKDMDDAGSIEKLKTGIRRLVAEIKIFNPDDEQALWIEDRREMLANANVMFSAINFFMWIVGLASLLAGVVGVSNIMIVTVSERTREFGIRKALGAPPLSILGSVIGESLAITILFGFVGMFIGIAISETACLLLESNPELGGGMFQNPSVGLSTALSALAVLVVAGLSAGFFPARKAVKIKPIEAMNAR